jgi:hypothetical protein
VSGPLKRVAAWAGKLRGQRRKPSAAEKQREKVRAREEGVAICRPEAATPSDLARLKAPHLICAAEAVPEALVKKAVQTMLANHRAGIVFLGKGVPPLLRRDALLQAGGFAASDAATWRAITELGWQAVSLEGEEAAWPSAGMGEFASEPATLFLSLSGREWAWPLMAEFLARQTFPHARVHLYVLDTSQNAAFRRTVRAWLAQCDYAGISLVSARVGPPGIADLPRPEALDAVRHAVAAIYNRFARACQTPLALCLEDDVIPPGDAFARLVQQLGEKRLSVSAVVHGRHAQYRRGAPLAWNWLPDGKREDLPAGAGLTSVGGNGFGCVAMRGDYFRRQVFRSGPPRNDFDFNFYHDATCRDGWEAVLDWGCVCRHYDGPDSWI